MFKNIIPGLVSLDTKFNKINGFHLCQDFDFFQCAKAENRFHYKVRADENIIIPGDYDFRSEYVFKKGNRWYYKRKILFWELKFVYDKKDKTFSFNKAYSFLPFAIGGITPVGGQITNIIALDLFLAGFICGRGMAVQYEKKNICFIAPGFNGKTTFLSQYLKKGAKYIAEDVLILDTCNQKIYSTCPFLKYNFWQRREIDKVLIERVKSEDMFMDPLAIDSMFLYQNSLAGDYQPIGKIFFDFFLLNSFHFINNLFAKAYIFEEGLSEAVIDQVDRIKQLNIACSFKHIKEFNINQISENHE